MTYGVQNHNMTFICLHFKDSFLHKNKYFIITLMQRICQSYVLKHCLQPFPVFREIMAFSQTSRNVVGSQHSNYCVQWLSP